MTEIKKLLEKSTKNRLLSELMQCLHYIDRPDPKGNGCFYPDMLKKMGLVDNKEHRNIIQKVFLHLLNVLEDERNK